ncbi:MAG: 50S ribosomal protein L24 [Candidatus Omnitrophota bacterium]
MLRVRRGDKVKVRAGKDKGKSGKVLKVLTAKKRVIVEGVNLVKKHMRRRSEAEQGGIKEVPASIHISNVNILCPNCNRDARFTTKILENKSKIRVCKRCEKTI